MHLSLKTLRLSCLGAALCTPTLLCAQTKSVELKVTNPSAIARPSEVVDLPMADVQAHLHITGEAISAHVAGSTKPLLTQAYATQIDGPKDRLLVLVDLAPRQTVTLDLEPTPADAPPQASRVTARTVPERKDDFTWENDVVAYRVYGPALEATGEIASGIDVWSKRVPIFVTNIWYARDEEGQRTHNPALSYHKDNGDGLDSYEVLAARGCGGTAVFADGKLLPSKNVTTFKILAKGPIRTDFLLNYAPWQANGATVTEQKRIMLDAGSKLNDMRATYKIEGAPSLTIAAGLGVHKDATITHPDASIISVWDTPQLASAGRIGTAMILPKQTKPEFTLLPMEGKVAGNALFLFHVKDGGTIHYYAGSAWSEADTPTQPDFDTYLKQKQVRIDTPVTLRW